MERSDSSSPDDSAYDSDFRFSLDHKVSYDSYSDSIANAGKPDLKRKLEKQLRYAK